MPTLTEQILEEADRCVKCGYCLPVCPTYLKMRNEAESPRGRIALIQGLLEGTLRDSPVLEGHLRRCLTCRACEPACPSGVRYGRIIDGARALHESHTYPIHRLFTAATLNLLTRPLPLRLGLRLLDLYRRSGLGRISRGLLPKGLRRAERLSPPRLEMPQWRQRYPASARRGRVALFTGCIGNLADQNALRAAIAVLNALGYDVEIPPDQGCCGAMHRHTGRPEAANQRVADNETAFDDDGLDAVIGVATACCAELREHAAFGDRVMEVTTFLSSLAWPSDLTLEPLAERVAVHEPCTRRLIDGHAPDSLYPLLQRIPQIDLQPLADNDICCGAAGTYMLSQPEMADALRDDKLAALRRAGPRILLTSNTGCALHLAAGIRAAGLEVEVMHPVELLDRQLHGYVKT
ncbi:MAG TPA: 4Fe-4S dicluster domain-containing protein [Chromatiales bacterium]|nr:4Fe-4S dicluster domain-containing protein [Chromatiales bacterium]